MDDYKLLMDVGVLAFTAFQSWNNAKIRQQIDGLKLWIIQNFEPKPNANFTARLPD